MNSITVYKGFAVAFWTTSTLLFVLGLSERRGSPLDAYALGCFTALVAMTFTGLAALECTVARVFRREAAVSRRHLANATAEALADELNDRRQMSGRPGSPPDYHRDDGDGGGATPIRGGR